MTSQDIQAALNLSRARTDQEDYPLNPDMITIPPGARVVRVFPNIIKLKIERSKQVLMDIQGTFVGRVKPGFDIAKIEILPPQVNVRGPESKFKAKERVRTSPIDVTGLDRPATFDVDLILPRPELRFVDGQTRATVLVTVVKK
jgi:YbbR domain-containing protein